MPAHDPTEHTLTHDWEAARRSMYAEKAAAISDCLDHLSDVERMLDEDGNAGIGPAAVGQEIRSLSSRLRSLRGDYEHHASVA